MMKRSPVEPASRASTLNGYSPVVPSTVARPVNLAQFWLVTTSQSNAELVSSKSPTE